jgi:NADH-quinone oxidoreductase subunit I
MTGLQKYFSGIAEGITSSISGMALTFRHFLNARKKINALGVDSPDYFKQGSGIVTLEYPYEAIPVPENGRYRLHNEMDDCIVCDKCAKICPVDCIEIEPIKSTEEIGITSDGSSKRLYAAKFDIDMAKCCYCGLCTTVCPTECLTMTPTFDYSEFDVRDMVYHFSDLSPQEAKEKQKLYEQKQAEKAMAKEKLSAEATESKELGITAKPVFKPKFLATKPVQTEIEAKEKESISEDPNKIAAPKPVFRPKMPVPKTTEPSAKNEDAAQATNTEIQASSTPAAKPVFKPKMPAPKIPPKTLPKESDQ